MITVQELIGACLRHMQAVPMGEFPTKEDLEISLGLLNDLNKTGERLVLGLDSLVPESEARQMSRDLVKALRPVYLGVGTARVARDELGSWCT